MSNDMSSVESVKIVQLGMPDMFQRIAGGEDVAGVGGEGKLLTNLLNVGFVTVPSWPMSCS